MPYAIELYADSPLHLSWENLESALRGLASEIMIQGPKPEVYMNLSKTEYGSYISCWLDSDCGEFLAIDCHSQIEEVSAMVGGQYIDVKRCVLVPESSALAGARSFFEEGTLS